MRKKGAAPLLGRGSQGRQSTGLQRDTEFRPKPSFGGGEHPGTGKVTQPVVHRLKFEPKTSDSWSALPLAVCLRLCNWGQTHCIGGGYPRLSKWMLEN